MPVFAAASSALFFLSFIYYGYLRESTQIRRYYYTEPFLYEN